MESIYKIEEKPNFIQAWFFAFRPKTLLVSFSPIYIGSYLAHHFYPQSFQLYLSVLAFLSAICIQIGANLFNDVLDFKKGTDNENRLGPKRATQNGWIPPRTVFFGALSFYLASFLFSLPLVINGGLYVVILGIISLLCGYLYTGGPFPLAYKGLGELFVLLFFGFAAVCGCYFIQCQSISFPVLVASFQVGLLACTLISINNFRDYENDKKCEKMTLSARFGVTFSRYEIACFFIIPYLLNFYWIFSAGSYSYFSGFVTLPLAVKIIFSLFKNAPSPKFNKYLGMASLHQILFSVFLFH